MVRRRSLALGGSGSARFNSRRRQFENWSAVVRYHRQHIISSHSKELATLTLYEQRITRVLTRNKAELETKQAARKASGADSDADLPACALPTTQTQPLDASPPAVDPAESKPATATPEQLGGFVRSSAATSPAPDAQLQNPQLESTPKRPESPSKWLESTPDATPIPQGALRNAA